MDALKPLTCSSTGLVSPSPLSSNLHLILTSSPIPLPPLSPAFDACQLSALAIKFSPLSRKIIPPQGSCVGSQLARSRKTMVEPYIWRQAGRVWSVTGPGEHSYPLSSPPHPFPHPLPSFPISVAVVRLPSTFRASVTRVDLTPLKTLPGEINTGLILSEL